MKKFVLLFFASLSLNLTLSQDVLTSSGAYLSNTNGSFSLTIGEVISETFNANNYYLTQGFLQNDLSNNQLIYIDEDFITIYPNPASEVIQIESGKALDGNLIVLNLAGSEVLKREFELINSATIEINELKQATYFVYYRNRQNQIYFLGNIIKIDL